MTREFVFERATKNTLRFQQVVDGDDARPDMTEVIYIYKSVFAGKQPTRIRVTVEEVQ